VSVPWMVPPTRLVLWGTLVLLLVSTLAAGGASASPTGRGTVGPPTASGCTGTTIATAYNGSLVLDGGPLPAGAAAGVSLGFNFSADVEVSNRSTGQLISSTCTPLQGTVDTGTNGSFQFELTLPASHCFGDECTHALGPYGPLAFGPAGAPPAGYEVDSSANGTTLRLTFVAELGGLTLDPSGATRTLSPNAPETFVAEPITATGSPSPITPTFDWNLSGDGWSFVGSPAGATVVVESLPGAGLADLTVTASSTVGTNRFSVGPLLVDLESVATSFTGGSANRTDLDVGGLVTFTADGLGAPGYSYTADASPGLGLSPVAWPCSAATSDGDGVSVTCEGTVAYPTAGTADPSVEITNTYSTAEGALPAVTVAPLPALAWTPGSPVGYAGVPLTIEISAAPGSGTPPYTQACLATGSGTSLCSTSPGPNWTFAPTYLNPGNYTADAWAVDSDGTNRSVAFGVTVAAPLALEPITVPSTLDADAPVTLTARLTGGVLPAEYWWNVSGTSGSMAVGHLSADGTLTATWVPGSPGTYDLTLTLVDGLGTLVQESVLANVGPAVATALDALTVPGAEPTVAGVPSSVAWQAVDVQGASVQDYTSNGSLQVFGAGGAPLATAYVNASGAGPLTETAAGVYAIPTTAWDLGRLALSIASTRAGAYQFRLTGSPLLDRTAELAFDVTANLGDLHFYDPHVVLAGARDNKTLYLVADEYGNPAPGAAVDIRYSSAGTSNVTVEPLVPAGGGATGAWVNYSAPTDAAGTLEVTDAALTVLLGPIAVPPAASPTVGLDAPALTLATLAPVGAVGIGLTAWAQRRRKNSESREEPPVDEDLRRLVDGRDRVIAIVREARALDLAGIESAWGSVAPPEVADWVASLVADGTLGARTGPDGVARFCLVASADGPPVVLLDPAALERATAARRELTDSSEPVGAEDAARD
jgi:hypothetical protein